MQKPNSYDTTQAAGEFEPICRVQIMFGERTSINAGTDAN